MSKKKNHREHGHMIRKRRPAPVAAPLAAPVVVVALPIVEEPIVLVALPKTTWEKVKDWLGI